MNKIFTISPGGFTFAVPAIAVTKEDRLACASTLCSVLAEVAIAPPFNGYTLITCAGMHDFHVNLPEKSKTQASKAGLTEDGKLRLYSLYLFSKQLVAKSKSTPTFENTSHIYGSTEQVLVKEFSEEDNEAILAADAVVAKVPCITIMHCRI